MASLSVCSLLRGSNLLLTGVTGFVGKWGVKFERGLMDDAFDSFRPMGPPYRREGKAHLTDRTADAAIEFLGEEDERPFCLSISFITRVSAP